MNRNVFFNYVRKAPFGGRLTSSQVEGISNILDEWDRRKLTDKRWLAYQLATVFHETGTKMQPVREAGGEAYLQSKKYYPWVGEGLVQVTWKENHRKFGATKPGMLMTWPIALKALFDGMIQGMFTNRKLSDYFNERRDDPVGARKIINGTDKAKLIAGYHKNFLDALVASELVTKGDIEKTSVKKTETEDFKTDDMKPTESKGFWSGIVSFVTGISSLSFFSSVDGPYALGAFALLLISISVFAWMYFSGRISFNRIKELQ